MIPCLLPYNRGPGNDAVEDLLHAGMANVDGGSQLRPQLAEALPTVENGLWRLLPDGQMETTWRIKSNARWQDGSPLTPAADAWQRVGLAAEPVVVPAQRERDAEYRANFPAVSLHRQPNELSSLEDFRISETPLPENGFRGRNRARYRNPEFEALIQRYFTTVPIRERVEVVREVVHHMTDQLNVMGMIYSTEPTVIGSRLINVAARTGENGSTQAWNAEQWDTR